MKPIDYAAYPAFQPLQPLPQGWPNAPDALALDTSAAGSMDGMLRNGPMGAVGFADRPRGAMASRLANGPMNMAATQGGGMQMPVMPPPEILVQQRAMQRANARRARIEARRAARMIGSQGNPMLQAMYGPQNFDQMLKLYGLNAGLWRELMKDRQEQIARREDIAWREKMFQANQTARADDSRLERDKFGLMQQNAVDEQDHRRALLDLQREERNDKTKQREKETAILDEQAFLSPYIDLKDPLALAEARQRFRDQQAGRRTDSTFDDITVQGVSPLAMRNVESLYREIPKDTSDSEADDMVRGHLAVRGYKPEQYDALITIYRNRQRGANPPQAVVLPPPPTAAIGTPTGGAPSYFGPLW